MWAVWRRNCFISFCLLFVRHPASQRPRPRSIQARLWGQAEELLSEAGDQGLWAGSRKSQVSSVKMLCQGCWVWYWFKSGVEAQEVRIRWEICIYWGLKLRNSWKQDFVLWWGHRNNMTYQMEFFPYLLDFLEMSWPQMVGSFKIELDWPSVWLVWFYSDLLKGIQIGVFRDGSVIFQT